MRHTCSRVMIVARLLATGAWIIDAVAETPKVFVLCRMCACRLLRRSNNQPKQKQRTLVGWHALCTFVERCRVHNAMGACSSQMYGPCVRKLARNCASRRPALHMRPCVCLCSASAHTNANTSAASETQTSSALLHRTLCYAFTMCFV